MKVKKFQVGGPAPAPEQAAQPGPKEQIAQMAQEIIGKLGPEASAMLAQMIMQMLQGGQQGGGQPQGQPTYQRKGGKLVQVSRK